MTKLLRAWGFPVGLLMLWAMAAAYTLNALTGMQSTQVPVQSMQMPAMVGPPIVIRASDTARPS